MRFRRMLLLLVLCSLVFPTLPADAAPAAPTPAPAHAPFGFGSTPAQDSGWVPAQVVGGGCNPNGSCNGTVTPPNTDTLYEYTPHREFHDQVNNLAVNLSQHGGDPTVHARQICNINGQQIGWAQGSWHHGASWSYRFDADGNKIWTGPMDPHWVFYHEDECILPPPTPTPTVLPTATPQPGTLSVRVYACGLPFATQITRLAAPPQLPHEDVQEQVAGATFHVPAGLTVSIRAAGYGDFDTALVSAQAGRIIRIDMPRKPDAGPCSQPTATPPPGVTPTPVPPPPPPPCTVTTEPGLQALRLSSPATGSRDAPAPIEAGPATLQFNATGNPAAEGTGMVLIAVYDVTSGSRGELARSAWSRTFLDEGAIYPAFARGEQRGFTAVSSSDGGGWHWRTGSLSLTTPDLRPGHIYEVYTLFVRGYGCASYAVSGFVEVRQREVTIHVREATLLGQDTGPIADHPVTLNGTPLGTTDDQGQLLMTVPATPTDALTLLPALPADHFLWHITGDCAVTAQDLDAGSATLAPTGGCHVTFTYVPIPQITGRAFFRTSSSSSYQPFAQGTMSLVTGGGANIGSVVIQGGGAIAFPFSGAQLRPHVGSTAWALSYTPPAATPPWTQTAPRAGSGGDTVPGDLALTFAPGTSTDNRFFVERDPSMIPRATISGHVRRVAQDGSVTRGAYGTVTVWWSQYNRVQTSVAGDGAWHVALPPTSFTPTLRIAYTKNIPTAVYDHAEIGTVGITPTGRVHAPNLIGDVPLGPDQAGRDYAFVIAELPPPPPPPVASGEIRLWMHSHLDAQHGVYRSTTQHVAWPHAETLDFAPAVALDPLPPVGVPGYRTEQRVVAWAYDGSIGLRAQDTDGLGRSGCRPGDAPPANADTSRLTGCAYRYREHPTAHDMGRQGRSHWAMVEAPRLPASVYAYRLGAWKSVDLELSVLVETAVVDTTTGERWTAQHVLSGSFVVDLVAPRTLK